MMIKRIVHLNLKMINKITNKVVYISENIKFNKINSVNKFCYGENNIPKIIKVIKDENNQNKIIYENFDDSDKGKKDFKSESKEKEQLNEGKKNFKLKIFGNTKIETTPSSTIKSEKEKNNDNEFNIFDDETKIDQVERNGLLSEDVKDNLLNYNSFFSDYCRVYVKAGNGGNGSISILKGPMFDQVSPQGGDGGNGGNIVLEADERVSSLSRLRKAHFLGNDGENGYIKAQDGKNSKDLTIYLPVGTLVYEMVREENYSYQKKDLRNDQSFNRKLLVDMDSHGKRFVICQGGKGGIGNFTKRTLRKGDQLLQGGKGEEKELEFVLKCLADVGFIGFPNAGKSTLLAALTRAVPKIASYPFTTLHPHMGKLRYGVDHTLSLADLPGLIEGAHNNKGLGHKFLKHVERTKVLLYLLDGSIVPEFSKGRDPYKDFLTLKNELELYDKEITKKPYLIAFNKVDSNKEIFEQNHRHFYENTGIEPIKISAKTGEGLDELTLKVVEKFDEFLKSNNHNIKKN